MKEICVYKNKIILNLIDEIKSLENKNTNLVATNNTLESNISEIKTKRRNKMKRNKSRKRQRQN